MPELRVIICELRLALARPYIYQLRIVSVFSGTERFRTFPR